MIDHWFRKYEYETERWLFVFLDSIFKPETVIAIDKRDGEAYTMTWTQLEQKITRAIKERKQNE